MPIRPLKADIWAQIGHSRRQKAQLGHDGFAEPLTEVLNDDNIESTNGDGGAWVINHLSLPVAVSVCTNTDAGTAVGTDARDEWYAQ